MQASPAAGMAAEEDIVAAQAQALRQKQVPGLSEMKAKCHAWACSTYDHEVCNNVFCAHVCLEHQAEEAREDDARKQEVSLLRIIRL